MRLADLGMVTDLVCQRNTLLGWLAAVRRGDFSLHFGGDVLSGEMSPALQSVVERQLRDDLARNARLLADLGMEMDDAEPAAGLPTCRVSGTHPLAATR